MNRTLFLSWAKFLIGWPLSLISIIFIIKLILDKSSGLNISISNINLPYLLISALVSFFYYLLRSYLWQVLLKEKGVRINFRENTYRFTFSELKRYTPGNIWSFLSRASQFTDLGIDKKTVGIALLADIQLVIIGSLIASLPAALWLLDSPTELKNQIQTILPLSIFVAAIYFIAGVFIYRKKYDSKSNFASSVLLPGYSVFSKFKLTIISAVTYFIFGLGNYLALLSVHILDFSALIIISSFFTFSLLVGYLSFITPTGLGIREAIITLGLTKIMSVGNAGLVSIFTRIVLISSEFIFLILVFLWQRLSKK